MYSRFVFIFCVTCFISCDLFKNNSNQGHLSKDLESINLKSDWKSNLGLNKEELDTLTFFVNALKDEFTKTYTSAANFNFYLKGDVFKIEEYIKRFLLKLKDKGKVKELISYIKYGRDNSPNVEGRDESLNIDAEEHYRLESRLASVFDNYFMFLNSPSPLFGGDPEDKVLNGIKDVCYEFRASHKPSR
ncbi:hypothetical protein BOFE_10530 (plasmid) [Candidatus Borrelia fainii]|uniref:Lipoprotein n=1 Tax=Candidatus Borrelia fainii TaxID=2518322 RepID=A0ABM8DLJ8_9SPIR|nr:hypothetical protein BOFE_09540 [Candidatus Borrelia fainii]BDU63473.1 hypothetical protein BOFE_10130 [Candidatus Borrelia fainii]BDU63512.1 hypothetical protein BOFE_10520 [Candidatus Borrelia fainii]BDU63513.1 hypothetical protein BOFE_10530 [Candidatus Borrelia fainii]